MLGSALSSGAVASVNVHVEAARATSWLAERSPRGQTLDG